MVGEEVDRQQKPAKGVLGLIVFRAAGDVLGSDLGYLQALRWHEKGEGAQNRLEQMERAKGGAAGRDKLADLAANAWANAVDKWDKFTHENPLPAGMIQRRAQAVVALFSRGLNERDRARGLALYQMQELGRALHAGYLHALALERNGSRQAAANRLRALIRQAEEFTGNADLAELRKHLRENTGGAAGELFDAVVFGDLDQGGAFGWQRHAARLELRRLTGKAE
jgi:hypothetical protein